MGARTDRITVVVVRTGGVAAVRREWRMTAEGDEAVEVETLVESASWDTVAIDPTSRDRFVWSITVSGPRGRRKATVPEARLDGPLQQLVVRTREAGEPETPAAGRGRKAV